MHIERDLAYFDTEFEAIEVAQQWAFAWICEREGSVDSTQDETPTSRSGIPAEPAFCQCEPDGECSRRAWSGLAFGARRCTAPDCRESAGRSRAHT
ncbi:MAG: hypothetical protein QOC89_1596, partial [Paraburkholderia sp.]|nr:hypothetical protein [Paraburkholderia sp.]